MKTGEQVLLLGGSGYLGGAYQQFFKEQGIPYFVLSRKDLDYTVPGQLDNFLKQNSFGFLLNAAGFTGKPNVDASELHKAECLAANAVLPGVIDKACGANKLTWGHISSGCIYTGSHPDGSGYKEEDTPNFCFRTNNCSFYSGTKALAEEILNESQSCYIWRLRIPFNHEDSPRNYLSKVMQYDVLLDVRNSISHLNEFVRATWECWAKDLPTGTYNVTNPGSVTTREVTEIMKKVGICNKDFKFFESEEDFMAKAANTPRSSCVLDASKLANHGVKMTPVHDIVEQSLRAWKPAVVKA